MSIPDKKICKLCCEEKDSDQFSQQVVKRSYGTYRYLYPYCKPCAVVKSVDNWRSKYIPHPRILRDYITETNKVCAKCGVSKLHAAFPKRRGSSGDRFGLGSRCNECERPRRREWHTRNPERTKANRRNWVIANKDHISAYAKGKHAANPSLRAVRFRKWAQQRGSAHHAAKQMARNAGKKKASPRWLTAVHKAQIEEFYEVAEARRMQTGIEYHVDHIYPLKGGTFRGLHVPWNLQVLEAVANVAKKNRVPDEYRHLFWEQS